MRQHLWSVYGLLQPRRSAARRGSEERYICQVPEMSYLVDEPSQD